MSLLERMKRHGDHQGGETLYYYDEYLDDHRPGVVKQRIQHHSLVYYVLEVMTGPPLNDSFLYMTSQMQVWTQDEISSWINPDDVGQRL